MQSVARMIAEVFDEVRGHTDGSVADYIPELASVDPDGFGIAVATTDGFCHEVGDTDQPFTIQSVSKAFTYAMALDAVGHEGVEEKVGLEPSGDAFNEISLEPDTGRPLNPMINAGAIAVTSMVEGPDLAGRQKHILDVFSALAGEMLDIDEAVYRSERDTGHRNRAIAHLLRNSAVVDDRVEQDLDLYFRQCSIRVTCRNMAFMGATLANDGINPLTGERVISHENIGRVLSVMASCGMYDYSGGWIARVGIPAKSGVGGGIVGVLPGQLAIAVYSPRLDAQGNSVRGVKSFEAFSKRFNLHVFNTPTVGGQVVRRAYRLSESGSRRRWRAVERDYLREAGSAVSIFELQGDLFFSAVERLSRSLAEHSYARTFLFDISRVGLVDDATEQLLGAVIADLVESGRQAIMYDPKGLFDAEALNGAAKGVHLTQELDATLEDLERRLLAEAGMHGGTNAVTFSECEIFRDFEPDEIAAVEQLTSEAIFPEDARLCRTGDSAREMFLLAEGTLDVVTRGPADGQLVRLATMSPGICVGDIAVIDGRPRTADIIAVEASRCYVLDLDALAHLEDASPVVYAKLIKNILTINLDRLRRDSGSRMLNSVG